jgi:glyoxylase-like metal-dependent hydrolase (beta-lactamase superfamily II)
MTAPHDLRYSIAAADGVYLVRTLMVNVAMIRSAHQSGWILVDAGLRGYADEIRRAADEAFGRGTAPEAIVLTHGHFDHVGSLHALLRTWDVPVYAHRLELPHLTGRVNYPSPDPLAGGGLMAWSSKLLPKGATDVGPSLMVLPQDRSVPGAPGWQWLHTPGHTAGHISLFREEGRVLVAGDAVTTVKQESVVAVATQRPEVHGPPAYFTMDWDAARESVRHLATLEPEVLATGHGVPLTGARMRHELHRLAAHFDEWARPRFGRYARTPAVMQHDGTYVMPPDPFPLVAGALALAAAGSVMLARRRTPSSHSSPSALPARPSAEPWRDPPGR